MYNNINGTKFYSRRLIYITGDIVADKKTNKMYTMKAYKYDGRLHYEQPLQLKQKFDNHIVLKGAIGRELIHYTRDTVFKFDAKTYEYFFTDRWYTAALVFDNDRNVVHVYCNIAFPCEIKDDAVEFIDLDVDVIVRDGNLEVVDIDEFEEHKKLYGYEKDLEKRVFEAVDQVKMDITEGNYPFNRDILKQG
jgi:protein associated with RNAse G/E